ncbi:PREDICTED: pectinesterase-like [Nicotiana attenuata]|uniref:Pectinesterase n=1 Tax=Nicotiana attenuata TaxID=49451 RepID=A0A1J6IE70_NICAT|nr:PREDICTED: pectinesterase-like [Nicotiana attenuata]OIT02898.1 pectinesterase 4 [Nicotiana attenuata]
MVGKIVVSLVSLILVVGVILGVVIVLHQDGDSKDDDQSTKVQMKASVEEFCKYAEFKEACAKSLDSVAKNESATMKDYLLASIQITVDEVKKSFEVVEKTSVNNESDPYNHMAVEDCKELVQYAIEELQASYSMVGDTELHSLNDRVSELLNWLGAVYSYQSMCVDAIEKPEYKSAIEKGMVNATQLTHNAINIVAKISTVLQSFNVSIPSNLKSADGSTSKSNRRLLEVNEIGHDSYPTWFPVADRKLLARRFVTPHAVVAKDGSGQYNTVAAALAAYPENHRGKYIVYVKAGIYEEHIIISKKQPNVFIFGNGAGKTIITGNRNFGLMKIPTQDTATFSVLGNGFVARGITFRNTAGPEGHQAVALRINGDMAAVFDCSIEGYQDTLYYQNHRQFYRNCVISGTVDFIFGRGSAVIQNSLIIARKPLAGQFNTITADGKEIALKPGGVVFQNCRVVPEVELFPVRFQLPTYLGRPWKAYSTTVFMESELGDFIRPEGWMIWQGEAFEQTCHYYEFANRGPGALINNRNTSFKNFRLISPEEAAQYTAGPWINGDLWLRHTGAPFYLGLGGR